MADTPSKADLWAKMESLKSLYEQGYLSKEDFEERKNQVIDELTGTKAGGSKPRIQKPFGEEEFSKLEGKEEESTPPPDFSSIQPEKAIKHVCVFLFAGTSSLLTALPSTDVRSPQTLVVTVPMLGQARLKGSFLLL
jgi:hypothetical protein